MDYHDFIRWAAGFQPAPILGSEYQPADFVALDLGKGSLLLRDWVPGNQEDLGQRIQQEIEVKGGKIGWGGYLEDRSIYEASDHFGKAGSARSLHLGIDLWAPSGQPIYAPLDGTIHSFAYNGGAGNYGATIILAHAVGDDVFYTIYGHLSLSDLDGLTEGQFIAAGQRFCHIGPVTENGGWWPHLHVQFILDIGNYKGDYPGVALFSELEYWKEKCPDPALLLNY